MLRNYILVAWRTLLRNKLYFVINILGLAIGISACLVIFLIVNFELSFDRFHPDRDRIYRVYSEFKGDYNGFNRGVSAAFPVTAKTELAGVENLTGFHTWACNVSIENSKDGKKDFKRQDKIIIAGPEYFDVFRSYEWLAGSATSMVKPFQVVLSESKAKTYFGIVDAREAIGKEIHYKDSLILSVSGIVKDFESNSDFDFTDFISLSTVEQSWLKKNIRMDDWQSTNSSSQFFIKLSPGTTVTQIESRLAEIAKLHEKKDKDDHQQRFYLLQPLSDIHYNQKIEIFDNSRTAAHLPTLNMLVIVALLLMAIAAINFINLETAQAVRRAKEVGIRKVIGSKRSELILHFLLQSFILTVFAAIVALPLAEFALNYFSDFIPVGVELRLADPFTLLFIGTSILVVSFLAGFYPAFTLSSALPALALKNQASATSHQSRSGLVREGLIVFQFTFAQALIIATLIVGWQISFMMNKDLGFSKEAIVYVEPPWWEKSDKMHQLKNELATLPEVKTTSLCGNPPASTSWSSSTFKYNNGKEELHHNVFRKPGDSAYFAVFNLQLIAGRQMRPSDTLTEFIINETYAKRLGFTKLEDALGKELEVSEKRHPIVGVVKDFHFQSLHTLIEPVVITNEAENFGCVGIKLSQMATGEDLHKAIEKMETAWKKIYPEQKFDYAFMDETIAKFYEKEQRISKLINTATIVAILISCLGLFGLASFTAMQRTKEIGIRKVLGATVKNIVLLLSREFVWLVMIAFIIAAPLSFYAATGWLSDFAYRTAIGWQVFALTMLASIGIVLLSVSYQALKAAMADPIKSLRYE